MVVIVEKEKEFETNQHVLVPKHTKLSDKDKEELLEKYQITMKDIPRISIKDPAISHLDVSTDDIIKIERPSPTSKNTVFYRRVTK